MIFVRAMVNGALLSINVTQSFVMGNNSGPVEEIIIVTG
jgi:hypothetical protein